MNKQRFSVVYEKFTSKDIIPKGIMDNKKNNHMCRIEEVCEKLNEQQAIINEQNEAIDYLKTVIRYTLPNQMVADVFKQIGEEYE